MKEERRQAKMERKARDAVFEALTLGEPGLYVAEKTTPVYPFRDEELESCRLVRVDEVVEVIEVIAPILTLTPSAISTP